MSIRHCLIVGAFVELLAILPAAAQMTPQRTVDSFQLAPGLAASVWASEPGLVNPTDMDIDERGRIWVAEGANYRTSITRPEGDRILILEDTHHTGVCDSYKVFVQDRRLASPLGICKLGNKLYVAQSPDVFVYTIDASGDHPVGEPEILFTGFEGVNHDHGVHAAVFGPDGRIYFDCGNEGGRGIILHGDGSPVIDVLGSQVGSRARIYRGKPRPSGFVGPREGFAFRCNPDGSDFEIVGYNFRNCYELCVDSFGTVWQSDNDDDGNQGCCLNYVMEGGNFGFSGPTGSSWMRDRNVFPDQTRQEAHWHQRWPGVVPNVLNTGAGAPAGICFYEGDLLPAEYRGALILADPGRNLVRSIRLQPSEHVARGIMNHDGDESNLDRPGAGYRAEPAEMVRGRDRWFRPDDVCVAPDGSLYVADWYDPGVGGHATGDTGAHSHNWHLLHGRIYHIAPSGARPSEPALDLDTIAGQIAALESPDLSRRYLGWTRLAEAGAAARSALGNVFETSANPYFRARALWLLARGDDGATRIDRALGDRDANLRVTAIRAARQRGMDMIRIARRMLGDSSPAVLRELCLAMRYEPDDRAIPVLVSLADRYDGSDRWYLEALGIGATDREAEVLQAWRERHTNRDPRVEKGIEWRLQMVPTPTDRPAPVASSAAPDAGAASPITNTSALVFKNGSPLPAVSELVAQSGDWRAGEKVFRNAQGPDCIRCHQIANQGGIVGPPLDTIGQKLTKPQIYDAILHPSAQILMGYETWVVRTRSGDVISGRKVEETDDHVTLLDAQGKYHDIPVAQIERKVRQSISLMPEGLSQAMTRQDLVNLVEFLATRK